MRKISLFLVIFLIAFNSYAITGNMIIALCKDAIKIDNNNYRTTSYYNSNDQAFNAGYCTGFVSSAADIAIYFKLTCPPPNAIYEQDIRIFVKYLDNNPEKLNQDATILVAQSLKQAFPCPTTQLTLRAKK